LRGRVRIGYCLPGATMGMPTPLRALVELGRNVPRWLILLGGLWVLAWAAVGAMGGYDRLWTFNDFDQSRFTAMAMLHGTLKLRNGLTLAGHDEQVYNGAAYTNWGFGVPLLQIPFHAAALKMARYPWHFFPDRAIYFFYLLLLVPILWMAFDRVLAQRSPAPGAWTRWRRHVLSWSATLVVLTCALFPLMSSRFLIYEETIGYLVIIELLALSAYVFALPSWSTVAVCLLGVAAGMGLLTRPTGLVYLGMWTALVVIEGRSLKRFAAFFAGLAPLLGFWLYTNHVRSGSFFSFGFINSLPSIDYDTPGVRFGSPCADTVRHTLRAAAYLARAIFFSVNEPPPPLAPLPSAHLPPAPPEPMPWYRKCHYDWELRPPGSAAYHQDPFLGAFVLALLVWMLLHHLARRERRLAVYLPYATFAALIVAYAHNALGFAWRYVGDFWPLVVLACVHYVRSLPRAADRVLGIPLAAVLGISSAAVYVRSVTPALSSIKLVDPRDPDRQPMAIWDAYEKSQAPADKALQPRLECGDEVDWPFHNGEGWKPGCQVQSFTNLYLGVPGKSRDDHYRLQFRTKDMPQNTVRVYLNGRIYQAHRNGDTFVVDARIHYDDLASPIVMATIEWTSGDDQAPGQLFFVELT
jgi:hypothetical protein